MKFIPRPVVIGFTNGIAVLIASTQIRDLFGLQTPTLPGDSWVDCASWPSAAGTASGAATLLALGDLAVILGAAGSHAASPAASSRCVAGSVVVAATGLPVDTIGPRFGGSPGGLPELQFRLQAGLCWRCCRRR